MPATGPSASNQEGSSAATAGASVLDRLAPPESATGWQISKFRKVLTRRGSNLERLGVAELWTLHDLVVEAVYGGIGGGSSNSGGSGSRSSAAGGTGGRLSKVAKPLPHPNLQQQSAAASSAETTAEQQQRQLRGRLSENILHALVSAFHASVDSQLRPNDRKSGLDCVRTVLDGIEAARTESVKRRLREEKERREEERRERDRQKEKEKESSLASRSSAGATAGTGTPAAAAAAAAAATANTSATAAAEGTSADSCSAASADKQRKEGGMGQLLSTATGAQQDDDDDSDDEIIILDGPPTPPPGGRKSRPVPAPKEETGSGDGDAVMTNGGTNRAAPAAAAAVPARPRHKQTAGRPAQYKTITALADTQRQKYSASQHPRPRAKVTIDTSEDPNRGTRVDEVTLDDVRSRLAVWDPYWDVVHDFTAATDGGGLEWGLRTGPVSKYEEIGKRVGDLAKAERYEIKTAGVVTTLRISAEDSEVRARLSSGGRAMKWGKSAPDKNSRTYATGDRRCILRMLPLYKTDAEREKYRKKRADTHLWPVGTFLQLNNNPIHILQRKQQSHDHELWKGMSHALDLTRQIADIRTSNLLEIVARDDTPYAIQVAVCDYVGPDALYDRLMTHGGPYAIPRYEYDEALKVALNYVKNQMVVLDSDHEDDGKDDHGTDQTYSLLCPLSMSAMETPVRGVSCRHIACFDLRNWLHNNVTVGGTRWRCGLCEDFISPFDLIVDGMFCRFLEQHKGEVSIARDKIQLRPDGSWSLMDANKLRYQNKKRSSGDLGAASGGAISKKSKVEPGAPPPPDNRDHEVIELD